MYPISLQGNGSINTFLRQRRNVGGVAFYAVRVVSKESRWLVHPSENFCVKDYCVGFEVIRAVVMKSSAFWYIKPCSPLKVNWPICFTLVSSLAYSSTLKKRRVFLKRRLNFHKFHGVISHNIELFINITVFWDVTPCSLTNYYQHIGGTCFFLLQDITLFYKNSMSPSEEPHILVFMYIHPLKLKYSLLWLLWNIYVVTAIG
jgi:hypothetical protein